jgi:hypothetical protein
LHVVNTFRGRPAAPDPADTEIDAYVERLAVGRRRSRRPIREQMMPVGGDDDYELPAPRPNAYRAELRTPIGVTIREGDPCTLELALVRLSIQPLPLLT